MAQKGIHPVYKKSVISCACGNKVETYSTRGDFMVDICSNCHPFYTGKQKFVDAAGASSLQDKGWTFRVTLRPLKFWL